MSIQHELLPRISVTGGFYHRHFQNLYYTANTLINPVDGYHDLHGHGAGESASAGRRRPGDHDVQPAAEQAGQTNNVRLASDNNSRVYNGFEVSVNARLGTAASCSAASRRIARRPTPATI